MVPTEYTAMAVPVFVAVPMPSPSIMSDKFVVGMQANIIATNNTPARPYILVETQENIDFLSLSAVLSTFSIGMSGRNSRTSTREKSPIRYARKLRCQSMSAK